MFVLDRMGDLNALGDAALKVSSCFDTLSQRKIALVAIAKNNLNDLACSYVAPDWNPLIGDPDLNECTI